MMILAVAMAAATPADDACGASRARQLIGMNQGDAGVRRRAQEIAGRGRVRWIAPNAMVTQDYSIGRLNLETDRRGVIRRVWCG